MKGKEIAKPLLTWQEVLKVAQSLRDKCYKEVKENLDNARKPEAKILVKSKKYIGLEEAQRFWFFQSADNEYDANRVLKLNGYTVVARKIKLDLSPKVTATDNYEKFSYVPEEICTYEEEHIQHNQLCNRKKTKSRNHSAKYQPEKAFILE